MGRFLVYFSYIGTFYRGVTSSSPGGCYALERHKTVQGQIMKIMTKLMKRHMLAAATASPVSAPQQASTANYRLSPSYSNPMQGQTQPTKSSLLDFTTAVSTPAFIHHHHFQSTEESDRSRNPQPFASTNNSTSTEPQTLQNHTCAQPSFRTMATPKISMYSAISSRTDSGVHANKNAMVIDLPDSRAHNVPHDFLTLHKTMNKMLWEKGEAIRIHSIQQVPDDFSCHKKPVRREYVYRIGVIKDRQLDMTDLHVPVLEREFCHIIYPPFNVDKFIEAAEVMCGTHNFTNFTTLKSLRTDNKNPVKNISINVKRGAPFMGGIDGSLQDTIDFWEVHISSKSFLYKQIRKIMSGLAAVASGKCSIEDLKLSLKDPEYKVHGLGQPFPPWGLFLNNVEYNTKDLIYLGPKADLQKQYRKLIRLLETYRVIQSLYNNEECSVSEQNSYVQEACKF